MPGPLDLGADSVTQTIPIPSAPSGEPEERTEGHIHISITESSITYESEMNITEIVFWLDVVKNMIMNKVVSPKNA